MSGRAPGTQVVSTSAHHHAITNNDASISDFGRGITAAAERAYHCIAAYGKSLVVDHNMTCLPVTADNGGDTI